MLEVEIRDFQSITHAKVTLQGFTALVGRSNIGKSAVIRAVKSALTGASVDDFVRHGSYCLRVVKGAKACKCFCSVHLRAEGFDLLWRKGDALNEYTFNGQFYDVAGRGTPDFLQGDFAPVKIGTEKVLLQVSDQFNPIFLLDQTGSVVADVLSDVAHLDNINVAARLAEKDRKEASTTRKVREKDIIELKRRVDSFADLDAALLQVRSVEASRQKIQETRSTLGMLDRFLTNGIALAKQIRSLGGALGTPVPDILPVAGKGDRLSHVVRLVSSISDRETTIQKLSELTPKVSPQIQPLQESTTTLLLLDSMVSRLRQQKDFHFKWRTLEGKGETQTTPLVSTFEALQRLQRLASSFERLAAIVAQLEKSVSEAKQEQEALQTEWSQLGACPLCTRPIAESHAHVGV